jgi:hypothetical protein
MPKKTPMSFQLPIRFEVAELKLPNERKFAPHISLLTWYSETREKDTKTVRYE